MRALMLALLMIVLCGCAETCHSLTCSKDYWACRVEEGTYESMCHTRYKSCKGE
jgi:hypothetical protein